MVSSFTPERRASSLIVRFSARTFFADCIKSPLDPGVPTGCMLPPDHWMRRSGGRFPMGQSRGMALVGVAVVTIAGLSPASAQTSGKAFDEAAAKQAQQYLADGKRIFRFDTFGSEDFWGGKLKLHRALAGEKLGGVGPGLSPKKALELGLKVDMDAVPKNVAAAIKAGKVDLNDPANTALLLKANAVVGVTGFFSRDGKTLNSVGIQCALCHSTVDDAFMPGVGRRLDGWPNRDLNVGAIISMAPDLSAFTGHLQVDEATVKKVLASWGPGKFDAELNLDG